MAKNLLLVDESPVIQRVVELTFEDQDVFVYSATDPEEALALARSLNPDIVLASGKMEGTEELEFCRKLSADASLANIPVLVLSSAEEGPSESEAITAGAVGVLNKPFPREALLAEVNRTLSAKVSPPQGTGGAAAADKPAAEQEPDEDILRALDEIETGGAEGEEEESPAAFPPEEMEEEKLLREEESLPEDIDNLPDEKIAESLESDVTETAAEPSSIPQTAPALGGEEKILDDPELDALFEESFDEEESEDAQIPKPPDSSLAFDPGAELEAAIPPAEPSATEEAPGEASLEDLDIDALEAELEGAAPAITAAAEPEAPPSVDLDLDLESELEATAAGKIPDEQDTYFDTEAKLQGLPPEDAEDASQEKLDIDEIESELEDAAKGLGLDLDIDSEPEGAPEGAPIEGLDLDEPEAAPAAETAPAQAGEAEEASIEDLDLDALEAELEDAVEGLNLDVDGEPEAAPAPAAEDLDLELEPEGTPESAAEMEIDLDIEEEAGAPLPPEAAAAAPEVTEVEAELIEGLDLDLEGEISLPLEDTAAPAPPSDAGAPDETAREAPTKDIGFGEDALRSLTEKELERAVEALVPNLLHRIETLVAEMLPSIAEKVIVREIEKLKRGE